MGAAVGGAVGGLWRKRPSGPSADATADVEGSSKAAAAACALADAETEMGAVSRPPRTPGSSCRT
eukprot:4308607-Prymnesium_polylepis.1